MKLSPGIRHLGRILQNIPGWRTKRKIVVIESDDWGSIRTPSREVFESLVSRGYNIYLNRYNQYDALESNEDLEILFNTLLNVNDSLGNHPIITGNNITCNPDFERIRESDYKEYFYEPFPSTFKRYSNHDRAFLLMKNGIQDGVFKPQFHGRDHVNVASWLSALQKENKNVHLAFSEKMISFEDYSGAGPKMQYLDALHYTTETEKDYVKNSLIEGIHIFKKIWGFEPISHIAPSYTWNPEIEDTLFNEGVRFMQGIYIQYVPSSTNRELVTKKYHYLGQKSKSGQSFLVRNAMFEPSSGKYADPVGSCLRDIATAFKWMKPAIICSHRVNYIGSINVNNRTKNINLLKRLLTEIVKKWPDVEFMSSDQLGILLKSSTAHEHLR